MKIPGFRSMLVLASLLILQGVAFAQTPTQIKQILPTAVSVVFNWSYNTADEVNMDSFVLKNTGFSATVTITSPYTIEQVIAQKTIRSITHTLPTTKVAGQRAFYNMIARKQGLADSAPSNVVQIDVVPTPPSPTNLNIAFAEVEFTRQNVEGMSLWVITKLL